MLFTVTHTPEADKQFDVRVKNLKKKRENIQICECIHDGSKNLISTYRDLNTVHYVEHIFSFLIKIHFHTFCEVREWCQS